MRPFCLYLLSRAPKVIYIMKLAAYYTLLNNLYPKENTAEIPAVYEMPVERATVPQIANESEFMSICSHKDIEKVLGVLDEHMQAIQLLYPKEYNSIVEKIKEI